MDDGASDGTVPSLNLKLEIPNTEFARKKTKIMEINGTEVIKLESIESIGTVLILFVIARVRRTRGNPSEIASATPRNDSNFFPLTKFVSFGIILFMKFNRRQKDGLVKVFLNLAQAVFIALIITNIAMFEKFSWVEVITGIVLFAVVLIIGTLLNGGE